MLHALELSPFFAVPGALRPFGPSAHGGRHGWRRRAMAGSRPGEMNIIGDKEITWYRMGPSFDVSFSCLKNTWLNSMVYGRSNDRYGVYKPTFTSLGGTIL